MKYFFRIMRYSVRIMLSRPVFGYSDILSHQPLAYLTSSLLLGSWLLKPHIICPTILEVYLFICIARLMSGKMPWNVFSLQATASIAYAPADEHIAGSKGAWLLLLSVVRNKGSGVWVRRRGPRGDGLMQPGTEPAAVPNRYSWIVLRSVCSLPN